MAPNWDYVDRGGDLLGGLGGMIGSYLGGEAGENDRRRAEATLASIRALYGEINPVVQAGVEDAVRLGPSAMESMQEAPEGRQSQLQALRALQGIASEGGMDAPSRAALLQAQAAAAQQQRAATGALRQSFQSRGMGGGGLELGLAAAAGQQSANANAMAGAQAAGDARLRTLQALASGASLAGQVRGQDYNAAADRANARDRVSAYNAQNQQAVRGRNIDRRFAGDQQTVGNRFRRADGEAGAMGGMANYNLSEAERKRRDGYAVGGAIGSLAGMTGGGFLGGW